MSATVIPYERFAARPVRVRSQEQNRIPDRDSPHLTHPPPATDGVLPPHHPAPVDTVCGVPEIPRSSHYRYKLQTDKIMKRIKGHGRGKWVCTPKDFLDLGTRAGVDQVLSRLVRRNQLRRVGRGLYDWPRMSTVLKRAAPADISLSIDAIVRRDGIRIMPSGLMAANGLGLTNAVPARALYLTDGASRSIRLGQRTIEFKHVNANFMRWNNRLGGPVVSALIWLGPMMATDPKVTDLLRRQLTAPIKRDLLRGVANLPTWAVPIVHQLQDNVA